MDFTKPLSFAGLSINTVSRTAGGVPMSGYQVDEFDPSIIDVAAFLEKRALQDGLDASDVYLGGRNIGLVVTVFGSTRGDFWDKSQALFAAFSPTLNLSSDTANLGFRALTFYQPTANISSWPSASYPDGIPLQYYVRPAAPPRYVQRRDEEGGADGNGLSKQFRIALLARDPRKYAQTELTVNILAASAGTASYRGDYPSFPILTFSLSSSGHSAFTFTLHNDTVVINLSSLSSGTYTLDYGKQTFVDQSGNSKLGLITNPSTFPQIKFAASGWNRSNTTGISSATLTYREAFA